ncbi:MAG TPA: transcription repressor NadR [Clostridiales bacterium]|nr:transcription repressor NadR [Clostridiales bacterium]
MSGESRRSRILDILKNSSKAVSASQLANQLGVSRQVIVGDVALLRASGWEIMATSQGYVLPPVVAGSRYVGKIPCQHTLEQTGLELSTIVRLGGEVLDVMVEHYLYGEIKGQLNIATQQDVENFLQRVRDNKTRLLSELTGGVHLHTIACPNRDTFEAIRTELERLQILYRPKD